MAACRWLRAFGYASGRGGMQGAGAALRRRPGRPGVEESDWIPVVRCGWNQVAPGAGSSKGGRS